MDKICETLQINLYKISRNLKSIIKLLQKACLSFGCKGLYRDSLHDISVRFQASNFKLSLEHSSVHNKYAMFLECLVGTSLTW